MDIAALGNLALYDLALRFGSQDILAAHIQSNFAPFPLSLKIFFHLDRDSSSPITSLGLMVWP